MVRLLGSDNMKINIYLKTGGVFLDRDVTNHPFGEYERVVSFWLGDKIVCYPLDAVDHWELFEDLDEDKA